MNKKKAFIGFRATFSEEKILADQAKKHGMKMSEYLRYKLLGNENMEEKITPEFDEKFKNDTMKFLSYSSNLILKIAEKNQNFTREEISNSIENSKRWLAKNGYISEEKDAQKQEDFV